MEQRRTSRLDEPRLAEVLSSLHSRAAVNDEEVIPRVLTLAVERGAQSDQDMSDLLADAYIPINPVVGRLLHVLALTRRPGRIIEFGTSRGLSTIYLAAATSIGDAPVITTESEPSKIAAAQLPPMAKRVWPTVSAVSSGAPAESTVATVAAQRREMRVAVTVAVASAAIVAVAYLVLVRTRWGQEIDDLAFEGRRAVELRTTARLDSMLRTISEVSLFLFGGAIVLVALAQRRVRLAVVVGACMSGAVLTTELLKHVVLPRPSFAGIEGITHNSYPSGHATIGMVLSLGVVMVSTSRWRRVATVGAALLAALFGTAVLSTGWHRPSDTVGAFAVALSWFAAGHALLVWGDLAHPYRHGAATDRDRPPSPALLAAAGLAMVALLVLAMVRSLTTDDLAALDATRLYVIACVVIDLLGVTVVLGFATLTGDRARLRREAWAAADQVSCAAP